jgi:hypothetical protein
MSQMRNGERSIQVFNFKIYHLNLSITAMEDLIYLEDILPLKSLIDDGVGTVLLIRHREMERLGLIEEYQSFQDKPAFLKCKYVVSFVAREKNTAVFFGLYKVKDIIKGEDLPPYSSSLTLYSNQQDKSKDFKIELEKVFEFEKYKNRIVIDWVVPRGWYNTFGKVSKKPVIKLLPFNYVADFPGLMNIRLTFIELKQIIENPDSHEEWYNSLTRLQAVYLILDNSSGNQYVGTTYGEFGLWQRWSAYVRSEGTGYNKGLEELKISRLNFQFELQFSILEVLTKTSEKNYCIEKESMWKNKLGSKAHGLNEN